MESKATITRGGAVFPSAAPAVMTPVDRTVSPLLESVLAPLRGDAARFVARAPGRLDVMGGASEYTGAVSLKMPLDHHVLVAVQARDDDNLLLSVNSLDAGDGQAPLRIPLSRLRQGREAFSRDGYASDSGNGTAPLATRCTFGTLAELLHDGVIGPRFRGLTVSVGSTICERTDLGCASATAAATAAAASSLFGETLDPVRLAALCQRVENRWCGSLAGQADAVCSLWGEAWTLTQAQGEPSAPAGFVRLPQGTTLVGIECGVLHEDAALRFHRVRTATYMGRSLIDRIVRHDGGDPPQWDGNLSRLSVADFVKRFRDRLPTKLKGSEFLSRFGETGDPLTRIDPSFVYRVRSRTEHHVYEHARASQFARCLAQAGRNGDESALAEAGELMYASHWSYGQRCGLGSVETDLLVSMLRRRGLPAGVYGAKVGGRGCGGIISVLLRHDERALGTVDAAMEEYRARTGRTATLLRGSSNGVLKCGIKRL